MNNKLLNTAVLSLLVFCLHSCGDAKNNEYTWEWPDKKPDTEKKETLPEGWTSVTSLGTLPASIRVYKSPDMLVGKKAIAYIAIADAAKTKFDVLGDVAYSDDAKGYGGKALHTPKAFYDTSHANIIINAGLFFYDNNKKFYHSQNLVVRDGKMLAPNQNYFSKDWVTLWYPTLGAFCKMKDGTFKTTWTYYNNNDKVNYCYPAPAENDIAKTPLAIPSASFPAGGKALEATTAIGGVSVLLHEGVVKNTYRFEMLDVAAESNQPRTAIGVTKDNRLVLFVCEGRNQTPGVAGLTTADVAEVMKAIGCVEALNLDGGGSTCMLVNGKEVIKGSDGKQRSVLTAIGLSAQ
jgi:hypothetical protein bacD2_02777